MTKDTKYETKTEGLDTDYMPSKGQMDLQDALVRACEQGNPEKVIGLLKTGAKAYLPASDHKHPFGAAVWGMNHEIVIKLIESNGDIAPLNWEQCLSHNRKQYKSKIFILEEGSCNMPSTYGDWKCFLRQIYEFNFIKDEYFNQIDLIEEKGKKFWFIPKDPNNRDIHLTGGFIALKKFVEIDWCTVHYNDGTSLSNQCGYQSYFFIKVEDKFNQIRKNIENSIRYALPKPPELLESEIKERSIIKPPETKKSSYLYQTAKFLQRPLAISNMAYFGWAMYNSRRICYNLFQNPQTSAIEKCGLFLLGVSSYLFLARVSVGCKSIITWCNTFSKKSVKILDEVELSMIKLQGLTDAATLSIEDATKQLDGLMKTTNEVLVAFSNNGDSFLKAIRGDIYTVREEIIKGIRDEKFRPQAHAQIYYQKNNYLPFIPVL